MNNQDEQKRDEAFEKWWKDEILRGFKPPAAGIYTLAKQAWQSATDHHAEKVKRLEAECAVMRELLKQVKRAIHAECVDDAQYEQSGLHSAFCIKFSDAIDNALKPNSGQALLDELERLRQRVSDLEHDATLPRVEEVQGAYRESIKDQEITRLRAALEKYGEHSEECIDAVGQPCTCGLDQALSQTKEGE